MRIQTRVKKHTHTRVDAITLMDIITIWFENNVNGLIVRITISHNGPSYIQKVSKHY